MTDAATIKKRLDGVIASGAKIIAVGTIDLPTGKVLAADPYGLSGGALFDRSVTPGQYKVEIIRTTTEESGTRNAFARVVFDPEATVDRYEAAESEAAFGGYAVDAGLGSFMDEQVSKEFEAELAKHEGNFLSEEMDKNSDTPGRPGKWAIHQVAGGNSRIAVFQSGWGDGSYESYWGLNAAGEPVGLVTDFQLS